MFITFSYELMYYTIYTLFITVLSSVHACIILCMYRPLSMQLIYMQQELKLLIYLLLNIHALVQF